MIVAIVTWTIHVYHQVYHKRTPTICSCSKTCHGTICPIQDWTWITYKYVYHLWKSHVAVCAADYHSHVKELFSNSLNRWLCTYAKNDTHSKLMTHCEYCSYTMSSTIYQVCVTGVVLQLKFANFKIFKKLGFAHFLNFHRFLAIIKLLCQCAFFSMCIIKQLFIRMTF